MHRIWANKILRPARRLTAVPAVCGKVLDTLSAHKYLDAYRDFLEDCEHAIYRKDHGSSWHYRNTRFGMDSGSSGSTGNQLLGKLGSVAGCISLLL